MTTKRPQRDHKEIEKRQQRDPKDHKETARITQICFYYTLIKQKFKGRQAYLNMVQFQNFLHFSAFHFPKEYESAKADMNFSCLKFLATLKPMHRQIWLGAFK